MGVLPQVHRTAERIIEVLPFLSLAVGALRLAKPLQDLFASVSILRGGLPEIKNIISLVDRTHAFRSLDIGKFYIAEGVFP